LNERFDQLFEDETYLSLKNWLFSYQLRKRHFRALLARQLDGPTLDVGCGISPVAPPAANVIYFDVSFQALRHLSRQHPEASYVVGDASRLPFRGDAVPRLVCSEVLEHIEQDGRTLEEMSRVLQAGGQLLISVPIHRFYYTFDDQYVGHVRRYEPGDLLAALESCGFSGFRVRKVAGVLEKLATYVMARSFALMSRLRPGWEGAEHRGRQWWYWPYRTVNSTWSYVCLLESKVTPLALTTIASIQCRKAVPAAGGAAGVLVTEGAGPTGGQ
jgi:SAM-dependent methyltransferase